jgi:hypothetical protein
MTDTWVPVTCLYRALDDWVNSWSLIVCISETQYEFYLMSCIFGNGCLIFIYQTGLFGSPTVSFLGQYWPKGSWFFSWVGLNEIIFDNLFIIVVVVVNSLIKEDNLEGDRQRGRWVQAVGIVMGLKWQCLGYEWAHLVFIDLCLCLYLGYESVQIVGMVIHRGVQRFESRLNRRSRFG